MREGKEGCCYFRNPGLLFLLSCTNKLYVREKNMNSLGVLESKWDPIRKKLVRRLLEEQDKYYGPTSHKREGRGARGRTKAIAEKCTCTDVCR
jgi:hypothetical protein